MDRNECILDKLRPLIDFGSNLIAASIILQIYKNKTSIYVYPKKIKNQKSKQERMEERHEAVDGVLNLFSKANHDLTIVQNRLHKEFQQIYPPNVPLLHSQLLSSSILGKQKKNPKPLSSSRLHFFFFCRQTQWSWYLESRRYRMIFHLSRISAVSYLLPNRSISFFPFLWVLLRNW